MSEQEGILVLGLGNSLHGDDGFGPRIIMELQKRYEMPAAVELADGGILGLSILPIVERHHHMIVVDTVALGNEPGTMYRFPLSELKVPEAPPHHIHLMGVAEVLRILKNDGYEVEGTVIGIEPAAITPWVMGLSPTIEAKIAEAVELVAGELKRRGYPAAAAVEGKDGG
ncbi:hydrogenase maturation protease [Paenibacillus thalictri]|uniref:Hydrogenase maturation protease n=1 Tax=Paenibacillus thalictri TaxID=2527873 RepID=A0A4V2J4L4_9BACL|nr:hydrogenase maturation protease [Paenibacillus thalictri]TBL80301.1 hydrogenase maturation protease [Paenibacillus thalictri]